MSNQTLGVQLKKIKLKGFFGIFYHLFIIAQFLKFLRFFPFFCEKTALPIAVLQTFVIANIFRFEFEPPKPRYGTISKNFRITNFS